uniref:SMC-Scp complex subunit ScpB n=1 Tax=Saccharopolyspora galaxeae TaxID=2781241 RepID=UPI0027DDEE61|nr:SMC-Scp complex subunit ScpB [Saccharopolyspora sp. HNM0986]
MSSVHDDVPGDELPGVVAAQAADDAEDTVAGGPLAEDPAAEDLAAEDLAAGDSGTAQGPDGAEPGDSVAVSQAPPDLTSDEALDSALEALLLVVDVPAGEELLASTLEQPVARIRTALQRLAQGYADAGSGFDLRRVGDGWRFYTRETYAPYVERYLLDGQRSKLTRAALETLAVVAYRQPVTRSRVAAVRGVNVDGVIRTLVGRGLVEEAGTDSETGGNLYCTTELFLERLGLSSLKDLPPLAPLLPEVDTIDDV